MKDYAPVDHQLEALGASPKAIDAFLAQMPISGDEQEPGELPQYGEVTFKKVMVGAVKRHLLLQLTSGQRQSEVNHDVAEGLFSGLLEEAVQKDWENYPVDYQPSDKLVITIARSGENHFPGKALGLTPELISNMGGYLEGGYKDESLAMIKEQINTTGEMINGLAAELAKEMIELNAHKVQPKNPRDLFDKCLWCGSLSDDLRMAWIHKTLKTPEQEHQEEIDFIVAFSQEITESYGKMERVSQRATEGIELPQETVVSLINSLESAADWHGPENRPDGSFGYWQETNEGEWGVSTLNIQKRYHYNQKAIGISLKSKNSPDHYELWLVAPGENYRASKWIRKPGDPMVSLEIKQWNKQKVPQYPHYVGGARFVIPNQSA